MRKLPFIFLLSLPLLFLSGPLFSQGEAGSVRLGIKLSPTLNINRIQSKVDSIQINDTDNTFKYLFGLFSEMSITENYHFSTGVMYTSRNVNLSATGDSGMLYEEEFILDYIEIPVTLKLLTNEFVIDTRFYAQIGFTFDITVNQRAVNNPDLNPDKYSTGDTSFYIGAGVDKMLGLTTGLFLGVYYQRGLIDISGKNDILTIKNDIVGLDFGVRF